VLPRCQRSGTIVEPMISTQWFTKMQPLAEPALAAVRDGRTKIVPEEWTKTYNHFLENIQDWCISRQLWWGHRIPAFFCETGHVTVTREENPGKCAECGNETLTRDPDVLDTWFSSGLWPFATLGWPNDTPALRRFYPSTDMETGYDILFFWVARMMMMGLYFMKEVPFRRVLLHGLVVDETGAKMGKLKANTIDPLDLVHGADFEKVVQKALPGAPIEEALAKFKKAYPSAAQMGKGFPAYGTDSLRLTLCSYSPQAKRIALSPKRIEGYRNFCNKLYNAVRFSLTHIGEESLSGEPPKPVLLVNRWILSRLASVVESSTRGIEEFRLDEGVGSLYHFVWDELCDWYLEACKPMFQSGSDADRRETKQVLAHCIETVLRALHPYSPFITEELWQKAPRPSSRPKSISLAPYPTASDGRLDPQAEREFGQVMAAIGAARSTRSEHEVHPAAKVALHLRTTSADARALLSREQGLIAFLVKTEGAPSIGEPSERPKGFVLSVAGDVEVLVGLKGLVSGSHEKDRCERSIKKVDKDIAGLEKRLGSPAFVEKAPPEVVVEAKELLASLQTQKGRLQEGLGLADELDDKPDADRLP
jgi:valyl-tRNA synthetase